MRVISENTLDLFRTDGRCEFCGIYQRVREPHHLWARGMDGGRRLDVPINLIALGSSQLMRCSCHTRIQNGQIPAAMVLDIVAKRESMTVEEITAKIWAFQRAPRDNSLCPRCEGKGTYQGTPTSTVMACSLCMGSGMLDHFGDPYIEEDSQ